MAVKTLNRYSSELGVYIALFEKSDLQITLCHDVTV